MDPIFKFEGKVACPSHTCVEKCCKQDEVFNGDGSCVKTRNHSHLWSPRNLDLLNGTHKDVIVRNSFFQDFRDYHPRLVNCTGIYMLEPDDTYQITENGSLYHLGYALTQSYCIENFLQNGTFVTNIFRCTVHEEFIVYEIEWLTNIDWKMKMQNTPLRTFFSICGIVSLICLILTFLVYWIIPGFNNLHGKIVLSNIISITIFTVFLLIVYNANLSPLFCTVIGFCGYFASISMFSWMTIMCFDLYWTFSRSELPSSTSARLKFRLYSAIGWGTAVLFTATLAIFQISLPPESEFNPAIGIKEGRCFINNNGKSSLYLFYIPLLVIMVFNILIFIAIVTSLVIAKKTTKEARSSTR